MTDINPRVKIGDNTPPPLDVMLKDRYEPLTKRQKAWVKKVNAAILEPKTEADVIALEKLFLDGDDIIKDARKDHAAEKEPWLTAGKIVDKFFNADIRDALTPLADKVKRAALAWRAAEAKKAQDAAAAKAEAERKAARDLEDKAAAAEQRGETKQADVFAARADAKHDAADQNQVAATQDIREASRFQGGGVSSAAAVKKECTGIIRADLDLEPLRYLLKEADLIAAINTVLKSGAGAPKGAVLTDVVSGSIRRR